LSLLGFVKPQQMTLSVQTDEHFMQQALKQAALGYEKGEIPVGAVVVANHTIIAKAHNQTEQLNDVTAHAEMLALTAAFDKIGGKYLHECSMYVTLEPCSMCAGALFWAQLGKLYFAASDPKRGYGQHAKNLLHPRTEIASGLFQEESKLLLQKFFAELRT